MSTSYQRQLTAVFGDPVDDNPTVVMEQAAFDAEGIPMDYLTIQVKQGDLAAAIAGMRAMNFTGANITMPHKGEVLQYLDQVSDVAKIMGAVNTLYWKDGKLTGENTDGKGFLETLKHAGVGLCGKHVTILGAGGAARAIAVELAFAGVAQITVVNHSEEHGKTLTEILKNNTVTKADYLSWISGVKIPAGTDILVNATPIGFTDDGKPDIDYDTMREEMIVCDVIPNKAWTSFLLEAKKRNLQTFNGLSMLVNQGAIAYELWTGKNAPVAVMQEAMEKAYGVKLP